jgi:hypothetical protein
MIKRTRIGCWFAFLLCASLSENLVAAPEGVYQTPPVLYVGDRGSLVYPLDMFAVMPENEIAFPDGLPKTDDIIIHRVSLDRRGRRVIIDFQAFKTGVVPLPPIPFGKTEINGLRVNVASILDSESGSIIISPEAGLLAAPGTLWVVTTFFTLAVIILAFIALLYAKGGSFFENLRGELRARFLLYWINFRLRVLAKRLRAGRITEKDALFILSTEMRVFLSRFWMLPCGAMSAEEFLRLEIPPRVGAPSPNTELLPALCLFFKKCDEARFGGPAYGAGITRETVNAIRLEAETLVNSGNFMPDRLKKR